MSNSPISVTRLLGLGLTPGKLRGLQRISNDNGTLTGHNTDWIGIVNPLMRIAPLKGARVALLGAGGAALAAAYGCSAQGASVTIFNRTPEKARPLAALCGGEVRFALLDQLVAVCHEDSPVLLALMLFVSSALPSACAASERLSLASRQVVLSSMQSV
jgi:shikimate 5-dehydrogenase